MKLVCHLLPLLLSALALIACTSEGYETGDGAYSYMRADFVEAYTDKEAMVTRAVTDDDETLAFKQAMKVEGISTPDSVYRMLLFYNKTEKNIEPVSLISLLTPKVRDINDIKNQKTDPVGIESSWLSHNGRYINIRMTLKVGKEGKDGKKQSIGLALESQTEQVDGTKEVRLRLMHDQNGVPEYYSAHTYLSIATNDISANLHKGDKVVLAINTYDGETEKTFVLQ